VRSAVPDARQAQQDDNSAHTNKDSTCARLLSKIAIDG
jgi:hypothetical protein